MTWSRSLDRSIARSIARSHHRSIARWLDGSHPRSLGRSVARTRDRSNARSLDRSVARSADRSLDRLPTSTTILSDKLFQGFEIRIIDMLRNYIGGEFRPTLTLNIYFLAVRCSIRAGLFHCFWEYTRITCGKLLLATYRPGTAKSQNRLMFTTSKSCVFHL